MTTKAHWTSICSKADLVPDSGICALIKDTQVALFYLPAKEAVYAIANYDPFSNANVLSRGLLASRRDALYVASPLYKQHFCLYTGTCLEDSGKSIAAWPARINDNKVEVLF